MFHDAMVGKFEPGSFSDILPAVVMFAFGRLWVDLAYAAGQRGKPGVMDKKSVALYLSSLRGMFPKKTEVVLDCLNGTLLEPAGEGGFYSDRFAKLHPELESGHRRKEDVGNEHSRIARNARKIAAEAAAQGMLLPPEIYKRKDGSALGSTDANRCLVIIRTLDTCLKVRERHQHQYTGGLIADAAAAVDSVRDWSDEERKQFFFWIADHVAHPALPKTTEQLLSDWERVLAMRRGLEE